MTRVRAWASSGWLVWIIPFLLIIGYVAVRMGIAHLWVPVATSQGIASLPNTYASVDHPFHVARAEMLWRQLASGSLLRWVGQHQGGYPVEFYPLGEAWLEVAVRALSLGWLPAQGAHTIAVIALFLLPGVAFASLAMQDGLPVVVALLALTFHIALPGGWYHGGYTELVQWGLVTNVAGAVATLLTLPVLLRYVRDGPGWTGTLAAGLAAVAVYCNPRSLVGLLMVGCGVGTAALIDARQANPRSVLRRLLFVAVAAALLAAPELIALARFGDLYQFVRYSGYEGLDDYLMETIAAVTWPMIVLGSIGVVLGVAGRRRPALTATATSLALYVAGTLAVSFVPVVAQSAPQLEPTRLMPLQRYLTLYLAAVAVWLAWHWLASRIPGVPSWTAAAVAAFAAGAMLVVQTRSLPGPTPDPASPAVPPVSLYPVAMSAQPQQDELAAAIRAADDVAAPGSALLVLGSALSWHQQLWAPLWTGRPLFADNWLWYWQPRHAGTRGYVFQAGNHYPDPELTLQPDYLRRHGIGGVVVTGPTRETAAKSPLLELVRGGTYDAYVVAEPAAIVAAPGQERPRVAFRDQLITATTAQPVDSFTVRVNWYPRWSATVGGRQAAVERRDDGYIDVRSEFPGQSLRVIYETQTLDWVARVLAAAGLGLSLSLAAGAGSARRAKARLVFSGEGGESADSARAFRM